MVATVDTLPAMPRKPVPPSEKKVSVGTRLAPALLAELETLAHADERTVSFLIEKAVQQYVEGLRGKGGQTRKK